MNSSKNDMEFGPMVIIAMLVLFALVYFFRDAHNPDLGGIRSTDRETAGVDYLRIADAESLVAYTLRDPDSAQFRNSRLTGRGAVCGQVNGKNGFGAYTGFTGYIVIGRSPTIKKEGLDEAFGKLHKLYC